MKNFKTSGIALVEVLIAMSILTIVVLGVYSNVSNGALAIKKTRNISKAVIIAKTKMNEFKQEGMRGMDINDEEVESYPGFTFDRTIERFEHELLPNVPANIVKITVKWSSNNNPKTFELSYIYATN